MKTKTHFFMAWLIISTCLICNLTARPIQSTNATVYSRQELTPLANSLINSFRKSHPNLEIKVSVIPTDLNECLKNSTNLVLIPQEELHKINHSDLWNILVAREVIIPVTNSHNPYMDQIRLKGIAPSELSGIIKAGHGNWGNLLKTDNQQPVDLFIISDKTVKQSISDFSNLKMNALNIKELKSMEEFLEAIKNNPQSIGFCKSNELIQKKLSDSEGFICLLPFDKNENGKLDYYEDIYDTPEKLQRGAWIGKYPKPLIRNYYLTGSGITENRVANKFTNWILTEGQSIIADYGLNELAFFERSSNLDKILQSDIIIEPKSSHSVVQKIILTVFLIFLAAGFIITFLNFFIRKKPSNRQVINPDYPEILDEKNISLPEGLYFDKTHTWIFMEKDGLVRIGINDFLPRITGKISRIINKNPGENIKRNEPILTLVQNGKHITLYAPVSGTISEYNKTLQDEPSLINLMPYSNGWIYLIKPSNWIRETGFYKMTLSYREWLKSELIRLKDIFAVSINASQDKPVQLLLQEGGSLPVNLMENMPPETWEDFQKNFIDSSIF